jgi:hypothetical protein
MLEIYFPTLPRRPAPPSVLVDVNLTALAVLNRIPPTVTNGPGGPELGVMLFTA